MDKKEQTRLRVQRYRDKQKSVTSKGVTSEKEQGVTEPKYITLSDGQRLRLNNHGYLKEDSFRGYQCPKGWSWLSFQNAMPNRVRSGDFTKGRPALTDVQTSRLSKLGIPEELMRFVIPGKDREGMVKVIDSLKVKNLQNEVRLGRGMTLGRVGELLEAIG